MENFSNTIAELCIQKYESFKKTGKPSHNEWTVLSGIILESASGSFHVVSLATGTKCLSGSEVLNTDICVPGCRLSDSHAEVLARRAFLRYLYDQIDITISGSKSDVFSLNCKGALDLNTNVSFHFFSSQTPCGDCSIFLKRHDDTKDTYSMELNTKITDNLKNKISETRTVNEDNIINDIFRTGAKCLKDEKIQDPHLPGENYHAVGPLRTKPGRGDPTLSLSCSDKMAKWNILGIQGALLSLLVPQIRIQSFIICNENPMSKEAMERGLYKRFNIKTTRPNIFQTEYMFKYRKGQERTHPCPSSIIWCAVRQRQTEIAVGGKKQGITKKHKNKFLLVTKRALLQMFLKICDRHKYINYTSTHPKKLTYYMCKQWSKNYQKSWNDLRRHIFAAWPNKPLELQNFVP